MNIIFPIDEVALLPAGAIVSMEGSDPNAQITQPIVKDGTVINSQDIVFWGDDNKFPQNILERARKSTIIPQALNWKANLISKQCLPFQVDFDDEGKEVLTYVRDNDIYEFLNSRHFKRYKRESANDIFWFLNIFPELILSKDRKKITHISPNEAAYCRWGAQNLKTGLCEHVYVNANWPNAYSSEQETVKIRALDPYAFDLVEWTREQHTNEYKFIYPSSYPTPGNSFYQLAHWDGIRASGWLDVLEKVPAVKKAMFENQMTIKYHIKIPREYWAEEYGDQWTKALPSERETIRVNRMAEINRRLIGVERSGIALATEFGVSRIDGKTIEGWTIDAVPDKLKDGANLADNMEATAHLLYSLGVDPTLYGFASKEMGSRSGGSDKREALLIYMAQMEPYQDVLYEPLNFIAEYNGWTKKYKNLQFRTKQTLLTTLDTGAGKKDIPSE